MANYKITPPNAGKGRGKGAQNKITKDIKEMIRGALDDAGGREYLAQQAIDNPAAFMGLVGKIIPRDVNNTFIGKLSIVKDIETMQIGELEQLSENIIKKLQTAKIEQRIIDSSATHDDDSE